MSAPADRAGRSVADAEHRLASARKRYWKACSSRAYWEEMLAQCENTVQNLEEELQDLEWGLNRARATRTTSPAAPGEATR